MDLRMFFQKVKQAENEIPQAHVLVVSNETSDGGKAGTVTETERSTAARLIVEGKARLACEEEIAQYKAAQDTVRRHAEEQMLSSKVLINLAVKEPKKQSKE